MATNFLVTCNEQGERAAAKPTVVREMADCSRQEAGDATLHIDGTATIKNIVVNDAGERGVRPGRLFARVDDIGVAGKAKVRPIAAQSRVEVFHIRRARLRHGQAMTAEAGRLQHALQERQGAALSGRDAVAADQCLRKLHRIGMTSRHGPHRSGCV